MIKPYICKIHGQIKPYISSGNKGGRVIRQCSICRAIYSLNYSIANKK